MKAAQMAARKTAATRALARQRPDRRLPALLLGSAMAVAVLLTGGFARGQEAPAVVMPEAVDGVITAHGISTFGGLELPADFAHLPYVNPDAPKGGAFTQSAVQAGFDSMNPYSVQGRAAQGSSMMLESILTGNLDEIGALYCLMCSTMEYPEDRSWVIFNLRDDVKFSDGTPLTAEDVVFSYQLFLTKGLTDFRTVLGQQVEGAEVLDPHKVKFTFKPGVPMRDLPGTVGSLPVLSKAHYEKNGLDLEESSMMPFLGSGPYVPDRIDIGRSISFTRNPDYWAQNLPINIGTNNFDTIRYEYFAEGVAAFEGFKGGTTTFRTENIARQWAEGYDFPAVTNGWIKKETLPNGVKANGQSFIFNLRREPWQDARVRRAISMMFNFEWSNQTLFFGAYSRINSFWENSWLAAEGAPPPEEVALLQPLVDDGLLPASILTDAPFAQPVSNPDRQLDRKNLRAASALLDEAGWVAGDDGIRRNARGEKLSFEILEDDPTFERVLAPFIENLRALGVDARLNVIDSAQYEVRTRNPAYDFDMISSFTQTDYFSGADLKQYYGSETADVSVFNAAGLKSKAVDRMTDVVMAAKTMEELTVASHAMDRVLRHEEFRMPMWYNAEYRVAYYDMYDHPERQPKYGLGAESLWWFNPDKAAALKAAGALR